MDTLTKAKRSWLMSRVKSSNTKPERFVRSLIHNLGFRFRLSSSYLPCKPDVILPKFRSVIFVHGCFWHQHKKCKAWKKIPSSNIAFWKKKFKGNIKRDRRNIASLRRIGWKSLVIWECQIGDVDLLTNIILKFLG